MQCKFENLPRSSHQRVTRGNRRLSQVRQLPFGTSEVPCWLKGTHLSIRRGVSKEGAAASNLTRTHSPLCKHNGSTVRWILLSKRKRFAGLRLGYFHQLTTQQSGCQLKRKSRCAFCVLTQTSIHKSRCRALTLFWRNKRKWTAGGMDQVACSLCNGALCNSGKFAHYPNIHLLYSTTFSVPAQLPLDGGGAGG